MTPFSSLFIVGLAFGATICAKDCTQTKLLTLASSSHVPGCASKVGFGNFTAISALTDEQTKVICDNSDCMALMDEMRTALVDDCNLPGTPLALKKDIVDPFGKACSSTKSVDLPPSSVGETSVGSTASDSTSTSMSATVSPVSWISAIALAVATLALQRFRSYQRQ